MPSCRLVESVRPERESTYMTDTVEFGALDGLLPEAISMQVFCDCANSSSALRSSNDWNSTSPLISSWARAIWTRLAIRPFMRSTSH